MSTPVVEVYINHELNWFFHFYSIINLPCTYFIHMRESRLINVYHIPRLILNYSFLINPESNFSRYRNRKVRDFDLKSVYQRLRLLGMEDDTD